MFTVVQQDLGVRKYELNQGEPLIGTRSMETEDGVTARTGYGVLMYDFFMLFVRSRYFHRTINYYPGSFFSFYQIMTKLCSCQKVGEGG